MIVESNRCPRTKVVIGEKLPTIKNCSSISSASPDEFALHRLVLGPTSPIAHPVLYFTSQAKMSGIPSRVGASAQHDHIDVPALMSANSKAFVNRLHRHSATIEFAPGQPFLRYRC